VVDSKITEVFKLLEEIKKRMGVKEDIKVVIKPYKKKIAFVYIDKNTIYINEKILDNKKLVEEVLWHELMHIKLKTRWHTKEFFELSSEFNQ